MSQQHAFVTRRRLSGSGFAEFLVFWIGYVPVWWVFAKVELDFIWLEFFELDFLL